MLLNLHFIRYYIYFLALTSSCVLVLSQDSIPRAVSSVGERRPARWLNIVLDINGILCETAHAASAARGSRSHDMSSMFPIVIGPKYVYPRPGVREFLAGLRSFANSVVIWSSMKKSTVMEISKFLFSGISPPDLVLGQESCGKIETSPGKFLMDRNNPMKTVFLKTLSSSLFNRRDSSVAYNADNTLLIDDSPEKSVCNHKGNAIFLRSWRRDAVDDGFLVDDLLPWLHRLHSDCSVGMLQNFVSTCRIGVRPLSRDSSLMKYLLEGMELSARNVGSVYDTQGFHSP